MTNTINPPISSRQRQVVIGTILGGSSLICPKKGKNCYLSMRDRDYKWLEFKAGELQGFSYNKIFKEGNTFRWNSACYPLFNDFYEDFYVEKERKLKLDHLSLLMDIAIAVWYGDCGKLQRGQAIFNTNIWGEEGTKTVAEFFNIIDYTTEIRKNTVVLSEDSTKKLFDLISPQLPDFYFDKFKRSP